MLEIAAAGFDFVARFEEDAAPQTVAAFRRDPAVRRPDHPLPLERRVELDPVGRPRARHRRRRTRRATRARASSLLYPGGVSETELLFPYGYCAFALEGRARSRANHFATIVEGNEQLRRARPAHALGRRAADLVQRALSAPASDVDRERDVLGARQLVRRVADAAVQAAHEEHPVGNAGAREHARVVAGPGRKLDDGRPRRSTSAASAPRGPSSICTGSSIGCTSSSSACEQGSPAAPGRARARRP